MYCLPSNMYVIGAPVTPDGSSVSQKMAPVALLNARNLLPPAPGASDGGISGRSREPRADITGLPSPRKSSVFVTSGELRPGLPSGGRFNGLSNGWFLGPSPVGFIQSCSPLLRSIAVMRPYGGFSSGSPCGPGVQARVPDT